jgi:hypothetical protein
MNQKCLQSFSFFFGFDQLRTNAANADTLCANLTMRREIVATRRAGVTTAFITTIPTSKGVHPLIVHEWKRTLAVDWESDLISPKNRRGGDEHKQKIERIRAY